MGRGLSDLSPAKKKNKRRLKKGPKPLREVFSAQAADAQRGSASALREMVDLGLIPQDGGTPAAKWAELVDQREKSMPSLLVRKAQAARSPGIPFQ